MTTDERENVHCSSGQLPFKKYRKLKLEVISHIIATGKRMKLWNNKEILPLTIEEARLGMMGMSLEELIEALEKLRVLEEQ